MHDFPVTPPNSPCTIPKRPWPSQLRHRWVSPQRLLCCYQQHHGAPIGVRLCHMAIISDRCVLGAAVVRGTVYVTLHGCRDYAAVLDNVGRAADTDRLQQDRRRMPCPRSAHNGTTAEPLDHRWAPACMRSSLTTLLCNHRRRSMPTPRTSRPSSIVPDAWCSPPNVHLRHFFL